MSDWEQRLRLYSSTASSSRQRSSSPAVIPVEPLYNVPSSVDGLAQYRAKSPNALERLRASTAMNLVALELRGGVDRGTRTTSPSSVVATPIAAQVNVNSRPFWPASGSVQRNQPVDAPLGLHSTTDTLRQRAASPSKSTAFSSPRTLNNTAIGTSIPSPTMGRNTSPIRAPLPLSTTSFHSPNIGTTTPSLIAESFNPQTILQMLESKIRTLETRNNQLENAVETLTQKNQELQQDVSEYETRIANHAALQSTVTSLQHEVDRLREELLAAAHREERRVEDVRRRAATEIDEARRVAHAREQDANSLRNAIRQLATIERNVE